MGVKDKFGNEVYREQDSLYLKLVGEDRVVKLGFIQDNGRTWLTRRTLTRNLLANKYFTFNATLLDNAKDIYNIKIETDLGGTSKEYIVIPLSVVFQYGERRDYKNEVQFFVPVDKLKDYII